MPSSEIYYPDMPNKEKIDAILEKDVFWNKIKDEEIPQVVIKVTATAPKKKVAVLLFDNFTGDTKLDYLGEGIADLINTRLANVDVLHHTKLKMSASYSQNPPVEIDQWVAIVVGEPVMFSAQGFDEYNNPIPDLIYKWSVDENRIKINSAIGATLTCTSIKVGGLGTLSVRAEQGTNKRFILAKGSLIKYALDNLSLKVKKEILTMKEILEVGNELKVDILIQGGYRRCEEGISATATFWNIKENTIISGKIEVKGKEEEIQSRIAEEVLKTISMLLSEGKI